MSDTKKSSSLLQEIQKALSSIEYGSLEIFVQDSTVTQITVRNIKKTSVSIHSESNSYSRYNNNGKDSVRNNVKVLTIQK